MKYNKASSLLVLSLIVLGILVLAGSFYYLGNSSENKEVKNIIPEKVTNDISKDKETYTYKNHGITIELPKNFLISESNDGGFYDEINLYRLSINAPSDYQKNTDFSNAFVNISISPKIIKCYSSNGVDEDMTSIKNVNGLSLRYNPKQPFSDNAMGGQRGFSSSFSFIVKGQCYRIEKIVGYRDLRGFAEPPYPVHFNEQKANLDLDNIISSIFVE